MAILGGAKPRGGFGTVAGVRIAVVSLQFLSSGFNMLRLSTFTSEFTWGALLLATMALNVLCGYSGSRGWKKAARANTEG